MIRISVFCIALFFWAGVYAAEHEPATTEPGSDEILASQGDAVLTQREIDAMFSKIPAENRLAFIRDGAKVDQLIRGLMKRKLVAADAVAAGYDKNPLIADRMSLAAQKELADAWMQKKLEDAPPADYEALAYEDYLANPDNYRTEPVLDLSHILLGTDERSLEDARIFAKHLDRQLQENPELFDEFVIEYSDDPFKAENNGRYQNMRRGQMVRAFEKAAFALEENGDISEPVGTEYGYHIIRLNGKSGNELRDYESVKGEAMARAKSKYREQYQTSYLRSVLAEPLLIHEGAVEAMAKRHFGENLERAPAPPE